MICVEALRNFRARPNYLSIESDKVSFSGIRREIDTLMELGYDAFQAIEQSALHLTQFPPQPASEGDYTAHRFEPGSSGLFGSELTGKWKSAREVLRQYRVIRLGYLLVGDVGIGTQLKLRGAWWTAALKVRSVICRSLSFLAGTEVPGWYDTHARHSFVEASTANLQDRPTAGRGTCGTSHYADSAEVEHRSTPSRTP